MRLVPAVLAPLLVAAAVALGTPAAGHGSPGAAALVSHRTTTALTAFTWSQRRVTAADLPATWRAGCPVPPSALRALTLRFYGFDGHSHLGVLVVGTTTVPAVVSVFRRLYAQRFPIRRMIPIDAYDGNDDRSVAADNTSAFNCRKAVTSGPAHWSMHAYGQAIDINPVENPYVEGHLVTPPAGIEFVNRSRPRPGMVLAGRTVVADFAAVGWGWGGVWSDRDYQHFSTNGH